MRKGGPTGMGESHALPPAVVEVTRLDALRASGGRPARPGICHVYGSPAETRRRSPEAYLLSFLPSGIDTA